MCGRILLPRLQNLTLVRHDALAGTQAANGQGRSRVIVRVPKFGKISENTGHT